MSTEKFYYCTEDGNRLIKYENSDDEYFCTKCMSIFKLHDNTRTIKVDDYTEITTGDMFLIKIN